MKKHFSRFGMALLVAGGVLLPGCAHKLSAPMMQIVSCDAYANALTALAGYRAQHLLTPEQIAKVDYWRPVLNAACVGDPDARGVLDQIEAGVIALAGLQHEVTP